MKCYARFCKRGRTTSSIRSSFYAMTLENPIPRVHHFRRHIVSSVVFVIIMVTTRLLPLPTRQRQCLTLHTRFLFILCDCIICVRKIPCGATVEVVGGYADRKCENGKFNQFFKTTLCRRVAFIYTSSHFLADVRQEGGGGTTYIQYKQFL